MIQKKEEYEMRMKEMQEVRKRRQNTNNKKNIRQQK